MTMHSSFTQSTHTKISLQEVTLFAICRGTWLVAEGTFHRIFSRMHTIVAAFRHLRVIYRTSQPVQKLVRCETYSVQDAYHGFQSPLASAIPIIYNIRSITGISVHLRR